MKPVIAISLGDFNGIGPEIALKCHDIIKQSCTPLYFTNYEMIQKAARLLNMHIPNDFEIEYVKGDFPIKPGKVSKKSGVFSFRAFQKAVEFTNSGICEALVTLPIHKEAWMKANIPYKGHTDYMRKRFKKEAIMMLGCPKLFVALFTEHIPLKKVPSCIEKKRLAQFLIDFYREAAPNKPVAVLGLNPHAGDGGALGDEEKVIKKAIDKANKAVKKEIFFGPVVPDVAFTPNFRKNLTHIVAMYHDQGLAPLKALYFDESINVSLNLPILRTSVDHGTAFDIAYKNQANTQSYLNAVQYAISHL
ncbi:MULTISPECIES: 4-hydroxythreonine-4-phosphate dehydrogenase [unclassified Nitratiruptor]|uniref:4-hydroxythreonine-4-phosphate dehydrogenase n=1 Tax=unclassified Nitratiruptor TaxID=2624044 RepID=UPI00191646EF|nr:MULTISPECIES: 4-hydroxythreonine-4-phosphate dehydrogenase [unclassified Nitratiruptor]BCD60193.1 4-hydroxythreonine-4-phosphate dehydrogenase [Nitratiruptor sp. YY08-10]BCD64318.1 4-hydroxythreonine-4-phosphate dehydrogenase [Nitratiruptor sp. YY08-14]